jgi:hypothetical protein
VKTLFKSVVLSIITFLAFGCSSNYYNVPRETFEKKVKILGVAPIFVDSESDIKFPEKEALVNLIKEQNRKNEKELVALLRETGTFFSVRKLDDDADRLFSTILFRRERRDDASVAYNKYFYKLPELKELVTRNGLDAVMLTVVSGLTREDTVRSSNLISYLKSDYNALVMTSQIYDADGNLLWEFPNFRENSPGLPALLDLQYPDFDEAKANATDSVDVKFKTIPGITRELNKSEDSSLGGNSKVSKSYLSIFNDMAALLKPEKKFLWWGKKEDKSELDQRLLAPPTHESQTPAPSLKEKTVSPNQVRPDPVKEEPVAPQPIKEQTIKEESIM